MHIAFLSTASFPSRLANRIHVIAMCKGLLVNGHQVDLFCKRGTNDLLPGVSDFHVQDVDHRRGFQAAWHYVSFLRKIHYDIWYTREPRLVVWLLCFVKLRSVPTPRVVYEVHDLPQDPFLRWSFFLVKRLRNYSIVTLTAQLKDDIVKQYNVPAENIVTLPDGVELELFKERLSKEAARVKVGLALDVTYVIYTGQLYAWKGVYTVCDAAKRTPDIQYVFVGGKDEDIKALKDYSSAQENVTICGYQEHDKIPTYLFAADILVLPNSKTLKVSEYYTSPLKLFEYMAAGRPIVASDLGSVREIIKDKSNGYLFTPDDPESLAVVIQAVAHDPASAQVAATAEREAQDYSWDCRAAQLMDFVLRRNRNL